MSFCNILAIARKYFAQLNRSEKPHNINITHINYYFYFRFIGLIWPTTVESRTLSFFNKNQLLL